MYISFIKPVAGWIMALISLVLLSPFLLIIIILLSISNKGKVFFIQKRLGLHAKEFYLVKFKTMLDINDAKGNQLPDLQRQSALGNFLRHYHIDELPQFINILKNEISFIGPPPLLVEYLPYYSKIQNTRHEVKPGITGLVQVLGGNTLNWQQRLRLDVFYVKHQSIGLDCRIIWLTMKYFFSKDMKGSEENLFSSESFIEFTTRK